nr:sulfatase-like hydrolase/transferase [Paracoccus saliphilus]
MSRARLPVGALLAVLILHGIIVLPAHPADLSPAAWLRPAPEVAIIPLALVGLGTTWAGRVMRPMVAAVILLVTLLKLADLAMLESLGRRFNPVGDLPLIDASVRLLAGSLGGFAAAAAIAAAAGLVIGLMAALWWATGIWMRLAGQRRRLRWFGLTASAGLAGALIILPRAGIDPPMPHATLYGVERTALAARTMAELRAFRTEVAQDKVDMLPDHLALIDRDVLVIFLESYGRTSFDTPFYAGQHLKILADAESGLQRAGLAMRSGFVTSPTHGGQSWLAHATLANGLLINDQTRYQAAIASGRRTLFHHARAAGFHTAAVMPAVVRPWPEATTMGFQTILAAPDLGYRGLPFNWVTMPDQFTLAAVDRLLRTGQHPQRLFAQIALISSHAPWVPVPEMVAWDQVGDGTVFDAMAQAGDPPEVVWRDRERVRRQYRQSIGYTLRTVLDYARLHADDPPLMILIGDHQAASSIGLDERRQVPIHVLGPAHLVERTAPWGLVPGLIPPQDKMPLPMEELRNRILRSFSGPAGDPPA